MKSNKSFKIEMKTRNQAKDFLKLESINIGGIRLTNNSKEPEIDPTINQCWTCGILNPKHNSQNCTGNKICIKCGETNHKFYECPIPKEENRMTEQEKAKRLCVACGTRGTHTTLDHRACKRKREILRERAMTEREKRIASKEVNNRDIELIKKAIAINNNSDDNFDEEWPTLNNKKIQHTAMTAILSLALLDEATNPGIFEEKLKQACSNNSLPIIKYKLEPNTAKDFQRVLCGAKSTQNLNKKSNLDLSKFYRDQTKDNLRQKINENQEDQSESEPELKMRKCKKPLKITVSTQKGASALNKKKAIFDSSILRTDERDDLSEDYIHTEDIEMEQSDDTRDSKEDSLNLESPTYLLAEEIDLEKLKKLKKLKNKPTLYEQLPFLASSDTESEISNEAPQYNQDKYPLCRPIEELLAIMEKEDEKFNEEYKNTNQIRP